VLGDFAPNPNEAFEAAVRAYDLSTVLADCAKTESAKTAILDLHRAEIVKPNGLWWVAWDRLVAAKRKDVTEEDLAILVGDLEALLTRYGDATDPGAFNPHLTQAAANRLINHYTRKQLPDEAKRIHLKVAQVFESFAVLADPMVGSTVLQTAVNAYRKAGNREEGDRVRVLMQEKIREANSQMKQIGTEVEVPFDEMERFLASIIAEDVGRTFARIASNFLQRRAGTEKFLADMTRAAPLTSMLSQQIVAEDHVVGVIGSIDADPSGRLVRQASDLYRMNGMFLHFALERAIEAHSILPEHWVAFANRQGLFNDVTLLLEGVHAWYARDFVKAVHVIVPQIEVGLRAIFGMLGHPTTKPDRMAGDVASVVNMGDVLYNEDIEAELGPDLTLHFKALFADPRGWNIRNRLAHGLLGPLDIDEQMAQAVIHTLLVLGAWREFAEHRR
jgi:lysyl-tRNA synthetase class 1